MNGSDLPWRIVPLRDAPSLAETAARWFHDSWRIPVEAYRDSMAACIAHPDDVPQWVLVLDPVDRIIGGLGLIVNDFHPRTDLTPNVCAVYVEPAHRRQGIARALLEFIRREARRLGIPSLYLLTEHTRFYEACGWRFLCTVVDNDGVCCRVYTADTRPDV